MKIEMLMRLTEEKGALAAPTLIRLIEEGDYRLRAAATSALLRVGKDVAELMKPLIAAGEELWLEEHLRA